jgi:hypothetical protein
LTIVDRVHRVGELPRIPIDHVLERHVARASYRYQINRGRALGIGIDPVEKHIESLVLHEIGHFLDHQGLGRRGGFASPRHPDLAQWRMAVVSTHSIQRLRMLERAEYERLAILVGEDSAVEARITIAYLRDYTEIWARSYVQYIAHQSRDQVLLRQLAEERAELNAVEGLAFWDGDDFLIISKAIQALFVRKGWIHEHDQDETRHR